MKLLLILLFVFSCSLKEKKEQNPLKLNKRVPAQNRTIINKLNSQNIQQTLQRIKILEQEQVNSNSPIKYENNPTANQIQYNQTQQYQQPHNEKIEYYNKSPNYQNQRSQAQNQSFTKQQNFNNNSNYQNQFNANQITPSIKKIDSKAEGNILEISGMQNKSQANQKSINHKFIFSTSASYAGETLDNAQNTLSDFGDIRLVKKGDMFALKVYPKNPILSKVEADIFLKNIIKKPFFDVYIEDINP